MKRVVSIQLPGLNIQAPWAAMLLAEKKTIETRFYPMPKKWNDRPLVMIETPGPHSRRKARIIGIIVFGESILYRSKAQFAADRKHHLVSPEDAVFGWKSDSRPKWAWPVKSVIAYDQAIPPNTKRGIRFAASIPLFKLPSSVQETLGL